MAALLMATLSWSHVAPPPIQGYRGEPHCPSVTSASSPAIYTLPASFIYIFILASRKLGCASISTMVETLAAIGGEASVSNAP